MMARALHQVADRVLTESGLLSKDGLLKHCPVDAEALAEGYRQLQIVGSERRGLLKLPPYKKGQIRIDERRIVVRANLLDDERRDVEYREVIVHEVAHDVLHGALIGQKSLPFGSLDYASLGLVRRSFSRSESTIFEREAIYLTALIQVPIKELLRAVGPALFEYANAPWTRMTVGIDEAEQRAADRYRRQAVQSISNELSVSSATAKIALDYWGGWARPPREWLKEKTEVRRANLR